MQLGFDPAAPHFCCTGPGCLSVTGNAGTDDPASRSSLGTLMLALV